MDYTNSWEGWTGLQVREEIQNALKEQDQALKETETNLKSAIKDISFDVDAKTSTVTCTVTKTDDTSVGGTVENKKLFTLLAVANVDVNLYLEDETNLLKGKTILKKGHGFTFDCTWDVQDEKGVKKGNVPGTLFATITDANGIANTIELGALRNSSTRTPDINTFTILAEYLPEGTNTIELNIEGMYGGKKIYSLNNPTFKLNVLDPKLRITFPETDGIDKLRALNTPITWNFSVTNSKDKALLIDGQQARYSVKLYYNELYSYTVENKSSEVLSIENLKKTFDELAGRQRIFALAEILMGGVTVTSNIVLIYFMTDNAPSDDYVWYAIQLNDVDRITSNDPIINVGQYDNTKISVYATTKEPAELTYEIILNNLKSTLTKKTLQANVVEDVSYSYIFKSDEIGLTFRITDGKNHNLNIGLNVLSIGSSIGELTNLEVSLNAAGKNQDDHTWTYKNVSVEFDNNFDWSGNGWINGGLLVNNGAVAAINYAPFTNTLFTASFKFNALNSISNECLISCGNGNTGFYIYPEKALFLINGTGISTEFDSTSTHEITFVRYGNSYGNLISIYVDGQILQSKTVTDNATSVDSIIYITSSDTQLYLYNVNIFKEALSFTNVLALYCFNQTNSTDIKTYIEKNNVFIPGSLMTLVGHNRDNEDVSKNLVISPESLPVGSRYLVISEYTNSKATGEKCLDPSPWKTIDEYPGAEAEKYKGIYHLVGNVLFAEKTEDGTPHARNFIVDKATLAALGTSSMAYPLKNFRLAFEKPINSACPYFNAAGGSSKLKAGDFGFSTLLYTGVPENAVITLEGTSFADYKATYTGIGSKTKCKYPLRNKKNFGDTVDSADAKIFCLKADYAESSGSHNTGFARLANDALTNSENICLNKETNHILPLLYIVNSYGNAAKYNKEIRSTIDGFPIYLFFKKADGTIIYHGKYNFNNEKSSKDVFGFEKIHDYFNNSTVKTESEHLKSLFGDRFGYYDATHFKYGITDAGEFEDDKTKVSLDFVNPTECWEFSNNTFDVEPLNLNVIGAFSYPYTAGHSDYPLALDFPGSDPFTAKKGDDLVWLSQAWEYRYPGLDEDSEGDLYYKQGVCKPYLLDSLYKWLYKHTRWSKLADNTYKMEFDNNTLNDFASNLHNYFNVNYLLKYFVLTKWFGNVDQRIKNCMLSFYCDPSVEDNTDSESPMGHMRAFYIFYDNDTILGVDNAGTLTQPWDVDEDKYPGYGKHAIWDNLEYCYQYFVSGQTEYSKIKELGLLIQSAYQAMRKVITKDKLFNYFNADLVDKFPDAIHNLDAEVKYYFTKDLNDTEENFSTASIAKLQGSRKFHRNRWLTKRTNWLDAKFKAGDIDLYSYQFKVGGTAAESLPGGTIKLVSDINDWRFHITDSTSKLNVSSPLLKTTTEATKTANMVIPANTYSISDFVLIEALYGCREIDFTNFKTSTWFLDLNTGGNILPYMKTFTLNSATSTDTKVFSSSAFNKLLTTTANGVVSTIFPNLETLNICKTKILEGNGESSTRFSALDLRTFSKLLHIDATGTDIDLILPNSGSLRSLIIQSPVTLTLTNKPNLTQLNIVDTSKLNTITLGSGNTVSTYQTMLSLIDSKLNTDGFTANVTFGDPVNYYEISDLIGNEVLFNTLLKWANNRVTNVTVSGFVYAPSADNSDIDTVTSYFKNLTISSTVSTGLSFRLSSTSLREGSNLTITLTSGILSDPNKWYWEVQDTQSGNFVPFNSLNGKITVDEENRTKTKLVLKAVESGDNKNATYYLKVGAYYGLDEDPIMYELVIPIQYIAVNSIRLESEATLNGRSTILAANNKTTLSLKCSPSNHTKDAWIKSLGTFTKEGCTINPDTLSLLKDSSELDAWVQLLVSNIVSNKLIIIFDKKLATFAEVSAKTNSNKLYWINNLLEKTYGTGALKYDPIKVSTLSNITLMDSDLSSVLAYNYITDERTEIIPLDLTYLQYCLFSGTTLTIPPYLQFTDLAIPYNKYLTNVNWQPANIEEYQGFGRITFPESLETANIRISSDNYILKNLKLDFSKTNLTKIYSSSAADTMSASVTFTYNKLLVSSGSYQPADPVFVYPSTLTTLGNYVELDKWSNSYQAIFNVTSPDGNPYAPFYVVPECSTVTKLGPLYNYIVSNSIVANGVAFPWSTTALTHLYHTFENNSNLPRGAEDNLEFTSVVLIGPSTFYKANITNLTLNANLTDIGESAFMNFLGNIKTNTSTTFNNAQSLDKVKSIDNYAFAYVTNKLVVEFKELESIGTYVFDRKDSDSFIHVIYLNLTTPFNFNRTSFGVPAGDLKNTVYMPMALQNALLSLSNEEWTELVKNINLETLS